VLLEYEKVDEQISVDDNSRLQKTIDHCRRARELSKRGVQ